MLPKVSRQGKFSNVDEQIKLLREGIDAQRKAIENGLLNIDLPGSKGSKEDLGGMGGDAGKSPKQKQKNWLLRKNARCP